MSRRYCARHDRHTCHRTNNAFKIFVLDQISYLGSTIMPSLILTGYPSAGKTTVAQVLKERALKRSDIRDVIVINEESSCPDQTKQQCYETSLSEKQSRAALKSAFDRAISTSNKQTLVILDSLNYIKGFRYELHCLAKAAGERHGILWVLNHASVVEKWNADHVIEQGEKAAYSTSLLQELIQRFEPPDERNRWDKPLFTIDVAPIGLVDTKSEAVKKSVYNMHALGESLGASTKEVNAAQPTTMGDEGPTNKKPVKSAFSRAKRRPVDNSELQQKADAVLPTSEESADTMQATPIPSTQQDNIQNQTTKLSLEEQLDEILSTFLTTKELRQGTSTQQHVAGNANVLAELDATTTRLVSAIVSAQTCHTGGKLQLKVGECSYEMVYPRTVGLPELRRLRKQYLQWARVHPPDNSTDKGIADSFLKYVEEQLK